MQRVWSVLGPEQPWLTAEEVSVHLGVSVDTLRKLVRAGVFPPAIPVAEKIHKWGWLDVVAYLHLKGRLRAGPDSEESSA